MYEAAYAKVDILGPDNVAEGEIPHGDLVKDLGGVDDMTLWC